MNINKHVKILSIVDKRYKIRQILAKTQETNDCSSKKLNRLEIVHDEQKKAA